MARLKSDYLRNLLFQKQYFPGVFQSYNSDDSYSDNDIAVKIREGRFFYVYVSPDSDLQAIIRELFQVDIAFVHPVSTCEIKFGYDNAVVFIDNNVSQIEVNHPWLFRTRQVVISKLLHEAYIKKSCGFFTYKRPQVEQLEKIKIKNYCESYSDILELKNRNDFFSCLMQSTASYNLDVKCNVQEHSGHLLDITYSDDVILKIIETINVLLSDKDVKEDTIVRKCHVVLKDYYFERSVDLIGRYIERGNFAQNFILVEKCFYCMDIFDSELDEFLKNRTRKSIHKLRTNCEGYARLHNLLSDDENILGLGDFMKNQIDNFRCVLEECS